MSQHPALKGWWPEGVLLSNSTADNWATSWGLAGSVPALQRCPAQDVRLGDTAEPGKRMEKGEREAFSPRGWCQGGEGGHPPPPAQESGRQHQNTLPGFSPVLCGPGCYWQVWLGKCGSAGAGSAGAGPSDPQASSREAVRVLAL